jgi:hypothetical protein
VYKKTFNEVLQEEQGSRDFGPLLGKMGVINAEGESAMTEDQWEAASESALTFSLSNKGGLSSWPVVSLELTADLYMTFAFEKQ